MTPVVVYVSGAPGAGKSTVANALAGRLGYPLLTKDALKETLYDSVPRPEGVDPLTWSRTLGGAAMELLWQLAAQPTSVLLEANFRPRSEYERRRLLGLGRPLVEVHCSCPPEVAADRYAARSRSGDRRLDVHPLTELTGDLLAEFDGPVGLGSLVTVGTSAGFSVDDIARRVDDALRATARAG
jgi:predicted kinase